LSWRILCQELAALYQARVSDRPARLPELPIQYADFALWQQDWLRHGVLKEQVALAATIGWRSPVIGTVHGFSASCGASLSGCLRVLAAPGQLD